MTDYLITRYNEVISASRAKMESAIAGATTIYNSACAEIIGAWQADAVAAAIELQTAMNARDRTYVQGPQEPLHPAPEPKEPKEPDANENSAPEGEAIRIDSAA